MLEVFQISMALLVSLAGLTAAIAEGTPISAFTLPIALATWYFVDFQQILAAPRWLPPFLGLIAFAVAGAEYASVPNPSYLSVGNHLLAYLTWILLIQHKEIRLYWTLMALTIVQIALTSLLTFSIWFGVALVAYTLLATWTLSLFLLYRSVTSLNDNDGEFAAPSRAATMSSATVRIWSGVSRDRHERLLTPRFYGSTVSVTCLAMFIAMLFFLFIPRIWPSSSVARAGGAPGSPLTGFSTEVRLGDMGEILESNEKVMDVRVYDAKEGILLPPLEAEKYLGAEPLFRGAVLEEYRQGRWHRPQFKSSWRIDRGIPLAKYRLRIDLNPIHSEAIFSFGNAVGVSPTKDHGNIVWDYFSNEMNRGEETDLDREFSYDLFTLPGAPDEWLAERRERELRSRMRFDPDSGTITPMVSRKFQMNLQSLTQLPPELEQLYGITEKVVGNASTNLEAARKIEDWLTNSDEFRYTMKLSVSNKAIDPILDFLQNRKAGHCEYFASAMATMLRCVGIPSRVITGFKGGVFNPKSNTLTIQQFHAHAWVEAYLDNRWMTFDPTPPERNETVLGIQGRPSELVQAWRNVESVWHRFSVMSREGQEEKIYRPLAERAVHVRNTFTELMQGRTTRLKSMLGFFTSPERWFSIEGAIVAVLIILLLLTISWLIRRLYQAGHSIRSFWNSQVAAAVRGQKVPFYERLVSILKMHGIVQQPTQTAREFIHAALPKLEPRLRQLGLDVWPAEVVENFYRVRFGHEKLSSQELQDLEQGLRDLEKCLQTASEPIS
ncbi:transglutaminase TgpA family protein [Planctomicrobium sp. SH661]|uniref:transglutaminase TgpA family protein n=1 Tax=Planctomicrobium sp. SH661 TaxID=3448124 RepID=UPI003F5ADE5C